MTEPETWTIGRLLQWTQSYLAQHGSDSARLDAEVLLAHARDCPRIALYTAFDEEADEGLRSRFRELVRRRAAGSPVAYLVGKREFYSLDFRVTPDVLIPRPETEFLVIRLKDLVKAQSSSAVDVLDVGTGSGVLAVCAARYLPEGSRVVAVDLSDKALAVARDNAQQHQVAERIDFLHSDLLEGLPPERHFDFIISNPPYVSTAEFAELPPQVRDHEPQQALVAGPTGREVIQRLIPQAAEALKPGGWLLLEVSPMISEAVTRMLDDSPWFANVNVTLDLAKLPRVVEAQRSAHSEPEGG